MVISKNQIQFIKSLSISKFRKEHQKFVVEGPRLLDELAGSSFGIDSIFGLTDWIEKNRFKFPNKTSFFEISEKELNRISGFKTPNQVLAVVEKGKNAPPELATYEDLILMLDDISDPGNMGTILRTADWFGIKQIICSKNCVEVFNPKVVQASMGSLFRIKAYYTELAEYLNQIPASIPVYGTLLNGENIFDSNLKKKGIILIGNESRGISESLIPFISYKLKIPDYSTNQTRSAESLNASIATAIVCAEFRRQSK